MALADRYPDAKAVLTVRDPDASFRDCPPRATSFPT